MPSHDPHHYCALARLFPDGRSRQPMVGVEPHPLSGAAGTLLFQRGEATVHG